MAQKNKKTVNKFNLLKWWTFFLRAEGVSCSLDVLYGGLRIIKLQILIKKRKEKKFCRRFLSTFVHQNPGSVSEFTWNASSGSGYKESGSTALIKTLSYWSKTTDQWPPRDNWNKGAIIIMILDPFLWQYLLCRPRRGFAVQLFHRHAK